MFGLTGIVDVDVSYHFFPVTLVILLSCSLSMSDGCFRKWPASLFKLLNQGKGQQKKNCPSFPGEKYSGLVKNNSREELRLHHFYQLLQSPFLSKEVSEMIQTFSSRLQPATVIQNDLQPFSLISCDSYILLFILKYS